MDANVEIPQTDKTAAARGVCVCVDAPRVKELEPLHDAVSIICFISQMPF